MRKIKQGDDIIVIAGKDKGKRGKVIRVLGNQKLVADGINTAKKHQKPNPSKGVTGDIVEKLMPIHISNVALFNNDTNKADRVGIKTLDDGRRVRFFKSTNEVVDA